MPKRTQKRAGAKADFVRAKPRVRDAKGRLITLKWNEPRPDLAIKAIASVRVNRRELGLAGLRLEAEAILRSGCGEREVIERLQRLGPEVAEVLVKIAASGAGCSCGAACAQAAIAALGFFPTAKSFDCLQQIADNASADLGARAQAIAALGRIGTRSCVEYLRQVLAESRDPDLRLASARGLEYSRAAEALEELASAVKKDNNLLVRQRAYAAMHAIAGANRLLIPRLEPPPRPRLSRPIKVKAPKDTYR